jgi:preprotein translocase SecE subunit
VARDRQRAKQRKARREPTPPKRGQGEGATPAARPLHRENVPGPVEHTGEVDEFEAALVAGAGGEASPDLEADERVAAEAATEEAGAGAVDGDPGAGAGTATAPARRGAATPAEAVGGRGGSRFLNFLRACWAELQRVQWPDRHQVGQATMVVIGFVILAGAFLGFADFVAEQLVDLIV